MRATAKPKRCFAPLDEVATHVRRRESIGATAQADATADDGEADDGSMSTTARADESDGEAEAVHHHLNAGQGESRGHRGWSGGDLRVVALATLPDYCRYACQTRLVRKKQVESSRRITQGLRDKRPTACHSYW